MKMPLSERPKKDFLIRGSVGGRSSVAVGTNTLRGEINESVFSESKEYELVIKDDEGNVIDFLGKAENSKTKSRAMSSTNFMRGTDDEEIALTEEDSAELSPPSNLGDRMPLLE